MGGHNAVIVLEDADLERAAKGSVMAGYGTTGQRCTAPRRIIAVRPVAEELIELLAEETRKMRVGPGDEDGSTSARWSTQASLEVVLGAIDRAKAEGAEVVVGAVAARRRARRLLPRADAACPCRPSMTIANEEVFGPVLPVLEVADYDEALDVATSTRYGLSSSIYTRDLYAAIRFMHETDAGSSTSTNPRSGPRTISPSVA